MDTKYRDNQVTVNHLKKQVQVLEEEIARLHTTLKERKEQNKDLRRSYEDFLILQTQANSLRFFENPVEIFKRFWEIINTYIPSKGFYFYTVNDKYKNLTELSTFSENVVTPLINDGIIDWVIESGKPIILPSVTEFPGDNAQIIIPLKAWEIDIGALFIVSDKSSDSFSSFDIELLGLLATQVTQSVENSTLINELKRTQQFLSNIINSSKDFIIQVDLNGKIILANRSFITCYGDAVQIPDFYNFINYESTTNTNIHQEIMNGKSLSDIRGSIRIKGKYIPYRWSISPIHDQNKRILGSVWIGLDMQEENRREVERLQAEKYTTVLEIAASVNHEINSPLTSLLGRIDLVLMDSSSFSDETKEDLQCIKEDILRIKNITHKLSSLKSIHLEKYTENQSIISLNIEEDK
jgi:PAS domain S-box-containing protein